MIYLDHNSTTPPCSSALDRMTPFFEKYWGASFSPHKKGSEVMNALDTRMQAIYDFISADASDRFVFTSSAAEGVNQVFLSVFLEEARAKGKTHIIISELEDAPTMQSAKRLEELGCTIKIAPKTEEGSIDLEALEKLITPRTALISATMANGLTGVIQPYEQILEIAKKHQILLHFDATYAFGKIPIHFESDYLTFAGDRIHSVKGSGGLFTKKEVPLLPLIVGGNEQNGLRGGSFDIPSFMALSGAVSQLAIYLDTMALEVVRLRDLFESLINGKVLFKGQFRLPNVSLIAFEKVHQEALLYYLNRKGVYANIGGPYGSPLSLLDETAVSFALSRMTTEEEVRLAAKLVNETVEELQMISEGV